MAFPLLDMLGGALPEGSILGAVAPYFSPEVFFYLSLLIPLVVKAASTGHRSITRCFTASLEIPYDDEAHREVIHWMRKQHFARRASHLVVETEARSDLVWLRKEKEDSREDDETEPSSNIDFDDSWKQKIHRERSREPRYTPAGDQHFYFRGHRIHLRRVRYGTDAQAPWLLNADTIILSHFRGNSTILKELLQEARQLFLDRGSRKLIIHTWKKTGNEVSWMPNPSMERRPLSTVILNVEQKRVLHDMKRYLHTRSWYHKRGIPHRRGYLFSGLPGTGKTSLALSIAGELHLDVYLLSLENLTDEGLTDLFRNIPRYCVILIEDIDCSGIPQNRISEERSGDSPGKSQRGLSLSALLNAIDGPIAPEGHILIMTTNHRDRLDPALLRPGRVDKEITFGYADAEITRRFFCSVYASENGPSDTVLAQAQSFVTRVSGFKLTTAEIQGYLVQHKNSAEDAVAGAATWMPNTISEDDKIENLDPLRVRGSCRRGGADRAANTDQNSKH